MIRFNFEENIRKSWIRSVLLSLELMTAFIAFFVSLAAFVFIIRMVFIEKRENVDQTVFNYIAKHVSYDNTLVMQAFSFLSSHYFLIPANVLLIGYIFIINKQKWFSIKIPVISLSSLLLMFVLKQFFHRQRPLVPLLEQAKGLSFPSGHALMSFTFYGLLIYLSWERLENKIARYSLTLFGLMLIFFIGLSRIYLRVHYASDVIAGFSLGMIWLVLSLTVLNKIESITRKENNSALEKQRFT